MANGFITNYVHAWQLWLSKNWTAKINERDNGFLLLKENILSIQFVLLFFTCYTAHIQKSFPIFFVEYTTKAARKMGSKDHAI